MPPNMDLELQNDDLFLKKDARRRYTLEDKFDIVTKVKDDGANKKEVAEQFGINKATLNAWLRQKKTIIKQCKGVQERQRFSYQEKHEILSKVKLDKSNKKEIMETFGIKKHTLNTWLRHRTDIARTSEDLPTRKANYHSPIWRIHQGVDAFFAQNQMRQGKDRINITGYLLGVHANKVKDELLERHASKELVLDEQELKHLLKFKGSDSWGRKYAKAKGWRGPEYRKQARETGETPNLMNHHHVADASDAMGQHVVHLQQHIGLTNHDSHDNSNNKPDDSYGYHMYAHNLQMEPNHLPMPQSNRMEPISNMQQHMHQQHHSHSQQHQHQQHQHQQSHPSNANTNMPQQDMLSQQQQQQIQRQQQIQQQQQTMQQQIQHHMQHMGEPHNMGSNLPMDPNENTMGMSQSQPNLHTTLSPNLQDPRSYNSFL